MERTKIFNQRERVFILVCEEVIDYEQSIEVTPFWEREMAESEMERRVEAAEDKRLLWSDGNQDVEDWSETKDNFCIWDSGRYAENHIFYQIVEKEVQ